jgi:N-acetylmuramic acid 6-phosphate etherase
MIDQVDTSEVVALLLAEEALVPNAVAAQADAITQAAQLMVTSIARGGRVHYAGAGTSGRLGVLDAVELGPTYSVGPEWIEAHIAGGMGALYVARENSEDDETAARTDLDSVRPGDTVVGLAASGRTPYVAGALHVARERGASTVLVSANPAASLAPLADVAILVDTGPEAITGSTRMKAATAQKIVLNTLSTTAMVRLGRTYSNLMVRMRATNSKLRGRLLTMLTQATGLSLTVCDEALHQADGQLPVALVMLLADCDAAEAREALSGGVSVREALRRRN